MPASLAPIFRQRFFNANGTPLAGGKLFTYEPGTTTPKVTYNSDTGTVANTNPVVCDADGYCDVWIVTGYYKFVLKTSADVTLWTKDQVSLPIIENGFSTGDVKFGIKTVADSGWVLFNDLTIGNAASGATGRAHSDTAALFKLLWDNVLDAWAPVSTGRGASAAADYDANKTIKLPRSLGRTLAFAGAGADLTSRVLGSYLGAETHTLVTAEISSHNHTQDAHTHIQSAHAHLMAYPSTGAGTGFVTSATTVIDGPVNTVFNGGSTTAVNQTATATNQATGGGGSHNNMQPSLFLNAMIKL